MGKAVMATPEQEGIARKLLNQISEAYNASDDSTKKVYDKLDWQPFTKVANRFKNKEKITLKMFSNLKSFGERLGVSIENSVMFILD